MTEPVKGKFIFPMIEVGGSVDPAVFCPAHGYLPPYEYFESPIEVDVVSDESIVFILDTEQNPLFNSITVTNDISSAKLFRFYDDEDNLLDEQTSASNTSYTFNQTIPNSPTQYVKCIVTLVNGSAVFKSFFSSNTSSTLRSYGIIAIYANTPNITTFNLWNHMSCKILKFLCTLDYCSSMLRAFSFCAVERFVMPVSMPALTTMQYALISTRMVELIFPEGFSAPLLTNANGLVQNAVNIETISIPVTSLTDIRLLIYDSSIKRLELAGGDNVINMAQFVDGSDIIELTVPAMPSVIDAPAFKDLKNLNKLTMQGTWNMLGGVICQNAELLRELHLPRVLNNAASSAFSIHQTAYNLDIIHVPDYMNFAANPNYIRIGSPSTIVNKVKKIYGDAEFASGEITISYSQNYYKSLEEVNLPKCKVASFQCGSAGPNYRLLKLTTVVVDWANSTYSATSGTHILIAGNLSTASIDAIFDQLPVVSGKIIDVRYNPGYATCDKTIATAKGWTML